MQKPCTVSDSSSLNASSCEYVDIGRSLSSFMFHEEPHETLSNGM